MVILLLGVVLGGRKSLWGAFVGATLVVLLPNLLSNRLLFHVIQRRRVRRGPGGGRCGAW